MSIYSYVYINIDEYIWEHYTAFYTVFYVNVFRSVGQVGKMEFYEVGQRGLRRNSTLVSCNYEINS